MTNADDRSYRDAMSSSVRLSQQDQNQEALRILDEALARAMRQNENRWVLTLSHHAAVISKFVGDLERGRSYYQKSLELNPDNPRALLGLADVAKAQGDLELAGGYAKRCHKALIEGDDFLRNELLELLLKKWPDATEHKERVNPPQ